MKEIQNLKSIIVNLADYIPGMGYKNEDYLQITEFPNGEGWDFKFNDKQFSLTYDEIDLINYLLGKLRYNNIENKNDLGNNI